VSAAGSAWSVGASILTFAFPMILFVVVAASLFVVYTKPSVVPGHREQTVARPIGFTPAVRLPPRDPAVTGQMPAGPQYVTGPALVETPAAGAGEAAGPDDPAARPGGPEGAE
jgi:hypothetical protein